MINDPQGKDGEQKYKLVDIEKKYAYYQNGEEEVYINISSTTKRVKWLFKGAHATLMSICPRPFISNISRFELYWFKLDNFQEEILRHLSL